MSRHLSEEKVIAALEASFGIQSIAAQKLGCNKSTVCRWIQNNPRVAQVVEDAYARRIDLAESKLLKAINEGHPWAIKYLLSSSYGAKRGYGNMQDINLNTRQPISSVSDEQLEQIIRENDGAKRKDGARG